MVKISKPRYKDFRTRIEPGHYHVDVDWEDLERCFSRYQDMGKASLDMNPDFQRGHVWTIDQQIAYVEFKISGGSGSDVIHLNCPGWMSTFKGPFVLVDGLQRLTAVFSFLHGNIPAFGYYISEFSEPIRYCRASFSIYINNLERRAEVLQWYLEMNSGGTPHTKEELGRVNRLLKKELGN